MTKSILIIDDNEDLRKLLAWLLQPRGYETLQAATGREGIEKAIAAQPSLILLDIRLPDMNGVEVARHMLELRPNIPIIGWTADYVSASYMQTLLEAGFIKCLQKPFSLNEVLRLVESCYRDE